MNLNTLSKHKNNTLSKVIELISLKNGFTSKKTSEIGMGKH